MSKIYIIIKHYISDFPFFFILVTHVRDFLSHNKQINFWYWMDGSEFGWLQCMYSCMHASQNGIETILQNSYVEIRIT